MTPPTTGNYLLAKKRTWPGWDNLRIPSVSSVRVSCVGSFRVDCGYSASRLRYGVTRGERPGKGGALQLTSTSCTCCTSTLAASSVYHAYFIHMVYISTCSFFVVPHGTPGLHHGVSVRNADTADEAIH